MVFSSVKELIINRVRGVRFGSVFGLLYVCCVVVGKGSFRFLIENGMIIVFFNLSLVKYVN